jgi:hypothetical protein
MKHTLIDLSRKAKVLHEKLVYLANTEYRCSESEIKYQMNDIIALAREIANEQQDN